MKLAALVPGGSVVDDLAFFAQLSAPGSGRRVPARHGQNGFEPTLIDAMRCVLKEWRIVGLTMINLETAMEVATDYADDADVEAFVFVRCLLS